MAASIFLTAIGLGMYSSTNSMFVKPICDSLGFARGEFTLYRTIITLVGAFFMPFYGKLIQKMGVKKVMLVCALMLGIVTMGYSFSTKLWHFYLLAAINGIFLNGVSFMSVGVLVSAWFDGKRGIASGLAYSGSGIGGAVMIPVISQVIERTSWRFAYQLMGIIGILILLPIVFFGVKDKPSNLGLEPYPADSKMGGLNKSTKTELSFAEAFRTKSFWLLIVAFFSVNLFAAGTNTHSAPYLSDLGYSTAYVSSVIALFMLFLTIGKVILGFIYDNWGIFAGNTIISIFCIGFPIFALLSPISPVFPWIYAVFIGMASCATSVPVSILLLRHFGQKDFPTIFSFTSMICSFGSSISVPAMGTIYDITGNYWLAWIIFLNSVYTSDMV